jgi:hypothetical protein
VAIFEAFGRVGRVRGLLTRFGGDHSGASAVEHALLACVVALVVVFAVAKGFSPRNFMVILQAIAESDERDLQTRPEGR